MLISAIVPVYNLEHLVSRCLDSLVRQTHAELEIICIDDGSTDGSAAILEQAARQDKRIQVIAKRNEGLPMARKTGIDRLPGNSSSMWTGMIIWNRMQLKGLPDASMKRTRILSYPTTSRKWKTVPEERCVRTTTLTYWTEKPFYGRC